MISAAQAISSALRTHVRAKAMIQVRWPRPRALSSSCPNIQRLYPLWGSLPGLIRASKITYSSCAYAGNILILLFLLALVTMTGASSTASQGDVHYYRNVNGIFEINLRRADIELDGVKHQVDHHIRLIAVDGRVPAAASEARLRRPDRGGGSGSSDGALV